MRPSWGAVLGFALVAVAVAAVAGVRVLAAGAAAAPTALPGTHASASAGPTGQTAVGSTTGARAPGASAARSVGAEVVVHVVGEVAKPGVVRLPHGGRVEDALRSAGGPTGRAELAAVNLARPLVDGEQIMVPAVGASPGGPRSQRAGVSGAAAGGAGADPVGSAGVGSRPVDLNTADAAALDALPGVGPVTAARILEWRAAHGRFTTVDELGEISGIGPKLLERLRPLVAV